MLETFLNRDALVHVDDYHACDQILYLSRQAAVIWELVAALDYLFVQVCHDYEDSEVPHVAFLAVLPDSVFVGLDAATNQLMHFLLVGNSKLRFILRLDNHIAHAFQFVDALLDDKLDALAHELEAEAVQLLLSVLVSAKQVVFLDLTGFIYLKFYDFRDLL